MARRSKRPQKAARPRAPRAAAPPPRAVAIPARASDSPRFWFDFTLPWAKVALVRVALFGVLAVDAFLALRHAPRYGSGFNVAHLRFLDGLAPGRASFTIVELALAYLFALFACGAALRLVPLAAALYGWVYFSSQLDSYQHHYLVFLVLVLACFAPWRRPDDAPSDAPARSWALRLVLVQLGVVYTWAAIAKLAGGWLDGSTLHQQISTAWMVHAIERLPGGWATAACAALALELFLAIAVWCRPLWPFALPLGIAFHVGIELSGLDVGMFSYVMVALYLLAIPDALVERTARATASVTRAIASAAATASRRVGDWPWLAPAALAVAAASSILIASVVLAPIAIAILVAASAVLMAIVARIRVGPRAAARALAAHLAAAAFLVALDHATSVAYDYYRFWGSSARRLGRPDEARDAYSRLLAIDPSSDSALVGLGTLDAAAGHDDDALARWHAAEHAHPDDARAYVAEARWLASKHRLADALAVALAGQAADPRSVAAQQLVDALGGGAAPPTARALAPARDDHDDPDDTRP